MGRPTVRLVVPAVALIAGCGLLSTPGAAQASEEGLVCASCSLDYKGSPDWRALEGRSRFP
jgi:hypothetical protein